MRPAVRYGCSPGSVGGRCKERTRTEPMLTPIAFAPDAARASAADANPAGNRYAARHADFAARAREVVGRRTVQALLSAAYVVASRHSPHSEHSPSVAWLRCRRRCAARVREEAGAT